MELPEALRKLAEDEADRDCMISPGCDGINSAGEPPQYSQDKFESFMAAIQWLYSHLLTAGVEFEPKKATLEYVRQLKEFPRRPLEPSFMFESGARWQHSQDAATIAALQAENAELKHYKDIYEQIQHVRIKPVVTAELSAEDLKQLEELEKKG